MSFSTTFNLRMPMLARCTPGSQSLLFPHLDKNPGCVGLMFSSECGHNYSISKHVFGKSLVAPHKTARLSTCDWITHHGIMEIASKLMFLYHQDLIPRNPLPTPPPPAPASFTARLYLQIHATARARFLITGWVVSIQDCHIRIHKIFHLSVSHQSPDTLMVLSSGWMQIGPFSFHSIGASTPRFRQGQAPPCKLWPRRINVCDAAKTKKSARVQERRCKRASCESAKAARGLEGAAEEFFALGSMFRFRSLICLHTRRWAKKHFLLLLLRLFFFFHLPEYQMRKSEGRQFNALNSWINKHGFEQLSHTTRTAATDCLTGELKGGEACEQSPGWQRVDRERSRSGDGHCHPALSTSFWCDRRQI